MKIKDVIRKLQELNPDADLRIVVHQYNKRYGVPLKIEGETLISGFYGGSISVWLPDGAYIAKLPSDAYIAL